MGDSNSEWEEVAAEVSATTQMRQEVADELTHVLGHTSITTAFLTMAPDDMRVHCLNLPQAPAYFRLPPDPRRNYSWALGGFNLLQSTFFANGVSPDQICAYPLDKGVGGCCCSPFWRTTTPPPFVVPPPPLFLEHQPPPVLLPFPLSPTTTPPPPFFFPFHGVEQQPSPPLLLLSPPPAHRKLLPPLPTTTPPCSCSPSRESNNHPPLVVASGCQSSILRVKLAGVSLADSSSPQAP